MTSPLLRYARIAMGALLALPVIAGVAPQPMLAQSATSAALTGTVLDPRGVPLPGAAVTIRNEATNATQKVASDAQGKYSFANLPAGKYTVQVDASGFNTSQKTGVQLAVGQPLDVPVTLDLGNVSEEITVEANGAASPAAALAPMDALLTETSARTEITTAMIQNFMSPIVDYGAAVEMVPGAFTTSSDGVGLGQSTTTFRGFPDGDFDIDFDGIPFYDTNTPTHHSWAFFPAQSLGGIDFDRSPGTASTVGPTPFGGSIHLLSKDLSPLQNIRAQFAGGSFNTFLYDAQYDSGSFGPGHKFNTTIDVHHMQSHGYQSLNNQNQSAGDLKFQYKLSDKTVLTGYSGVVWVDANTPNFKATRCQMYGVSSTNAYSCIISGTTLYPYTGAGINFLLTNNSDPELYLDTRYNYYHVPTDFEYVGLHKEFGKGITFEIKPYTYNYDNSEKYSNAVPITDNPALSGTTYAPLAAKVVLCNTPNSKGVLPCGVDKYNSYRKYGEISQLSWVSKYGVLNAGAWYEWAKTNRHQLPSDPLNNWADGILPNFAEKFDTNSYQPFIEYRYHATSKLDVTAGVKFAYYTISTQQFADNGGKIGNLGTSPTSYLGNPNAFITNGGSFFSTLPSVEANYRLRNNWSVYGQYAEGSIVPPSATFDYTQSATGTPVAALPKQQLNTTYQTGTVFKLKHVTFDANYYYIAFDSGYSSVLNSAGEPVFYLQPGSITKGVEGESNIYLGKGLSVYLNATDDRALYSGTMAVSCNTTAANGCTASTPQLTVSAPGYLWIQNTPSDTETEAILYQRKAWDAGFFNKRVGTEYIDDGAYHNQATVNPFTIANAFVNYTIRNGSRFDQTKVRLSFDNLFNSSNETNIALKAASVTQNIVANGTTYTDPFNTVGQTPINGQDTISILSGRSIILSVVFGLSPRR
jgi:iron complex outermembrane receptor protein